MSTETAEKAIKVKDSEAFLSKRRKKLITDPLVDDNLGSNNTNAAYLGNGLVGYFCGSNV